MKEIGSEFWNVPLTEKENHCFPESTEWFISGRSALKAIISELHDCNSVSIPSWCCESMVKPFIEAGKEVSFYPVYWNDGLVQEIQLGSDIVFLMDYFGYSSPETDLSGYKGVVIRDLTHSIFSASMFDGDYCFGSLRKWCGVWTGGYAWTDDKHNLSCGTNNSSRYIDLRKKAMNLKSIYINTKNTSNKNYLRVYEDAENELELVGIEPASDRDIALANNLDIEFIKKRHRKNANILCKAFSDWLIFPEMKESDCPMFVPILVPNGKRNKLRAYLTEKEIYCPIHWPKPEECDSNIYDLELSLVCDQRYGIEDMKQIISVILEYYKD